MKIAKFNKDTVLQFMFARSPIINCGVKIILLFLLRKGLKITFIHQIPQIFVQSLLKEIIIIRIAVEQRV